MMKKKLLRLIMTVLIGLLLFWLLGQRNGNRHDFKKKIKGEKVGVDTDYYKLLKEKLVEDKRTRSGFRMESDTPYVYPEFKDTLYG